MNIILQQQFSIPPNDPKTSKELLDNMFPEQKREEKDIRTTKEILDNLTDSLEIDQLKDITTEIQYLATTWLDGFEREIFKGLTLQEFLHESK